MIRFFFLWLFIVLGLSSCATAQGGAYSTKNKKAIKLFEEAMQYPNKNVDPQTGGPHYSGAIEMLQKALGRDENFLEAHQLIGEMYRVTRKSEKAVHHFKRALEIAPNQNLGGVLFYDIGELQMQNGDYEDALKYLDKVLTGNNRGISKELLWSANRMRESATFSIDARKNPSAIDPKNIGPAINTEHPEYFPTITVDGRTFLFTRELPVKGRTYRGQEDFFVAHLSEKNIWQKAQPMPPHINTDRNEGAPTLSADGRTLIFVACADEAGDYGLDREGRGSCDLFITRKIGKQWTRPVNLPGEVNTFHWESQPSLSADGKTLYFIRRTGRPGSQRSDIYVSYLSEDGKWGKAERLPENINTPMRETSVHIHPDGQTIYFSSNGHIGLGGFDIFMSKKDPLGNWGDPINLGYPINTENDENSLLVGPDGEIAFFASDRPGGYGDLDIYYFTLPEEFRPINTTYFEGIVFDARDRKPLAGKFELIDLATGNTVIQSEADKISGEFLVALPTDRSYALNVSFPGYAFFSKHFDMIERADLKALQMEVPLIPTSAAGSVRLANVFFDLNKATLREESFVELNKLLNFLQENETVRIEIGGHTDTRGDAKTNLSLSENRAKAVYQFLIDKGIATNRLSYKGYGQTQPIITDEEIVAMPTEQERENAHQENRRTEYKILP